LISVGFELGFGNGQRMLSLWGDRGLCLVRKFATDFVFCDPRFWVLFEVFRRTRLLIWFNKILLNSKGLGGLLLVWLS